MKRAVEPELMAEEAQALAYARADFESAHSSYPKLFAEKFPRRPRRAFALDLGCGPCDVTMRFAKANPGWVFHAVDGSAAMLKHARTAIARRHGLSRRIKLVEESWIRINRYLVALFVEHTDSTGRKVAWPSDEKNPVIHRPTLLSTNSETAMTWIRVKA